MYTTNAIQALFPYWEDPSFDSIYNISIKYPIYHQVFSNLLAWNTLSDEFGTQRTYFESFSSSQTSSLSIALVDDIMINIDYRDVHSVWHDMKKKFEYAHQMAQTTLLKLTKKLQLGVRDYRKINHIIIPNSPMRSMGKYRLVIYRYVLHMLKMFLLKLVSERYLNIVTVDNTYISASKLNILKKGTCILPLKKKTKLILTVS